jgi:hypothetical protein
MNKSQEVASPGAQASGSSRRLKLASQASGSSQQLKPAAQVSCSCKSFVGQTQVLIGFYIWTCFENPRKRTVDPLNLPMFQHYRELPNCS